MENSHESRVIVVTAEALWDQFMTRKRAAAHSTDRPSVKALRHLLSSRPMSGKTAKQLMAAQGFSAKQIRAARECLAVHMTRSGFGAASVVMWSVITPVAGDVKPTVVPCLTQSCPPAEQGTTDQGHDWENDVEDL
ncbi:hypothetical protein [Pseudomonas sp. DSP3-2-2]|uniref:hypothetical protein n=1 Tax=unclassified Pseudomonas TaxID=196821 RepID=UPI003CE7DE98